MQSIPRVVVTLAVVLLALLAGWWLWHFYMIAPWTRDARVRADVVTIAPDVSGWVVELKVRDNQQVKAGDLLMSIDRERYQAALEKARALAETRRQQLNLRQHEASRRVHLGPQAISAELRENAQINAEIARAEFQQAEAEVKLAELNLARSEVRAPRAGQITNLHLAQGNYVQAGQAVMALVADDSFYVQAYFEDKDSGERQLYSKPGEYDLSSGLRYIHVCEFVCFVSIFTTVRYFPSNSPLFTNKLWCYTRTLPCPENHRVVYQWIDLKKSEHGFEEVASQEFALDPETQEFTVTNLQDGTSATDKLRFSELVEGATVGSYAPAAKS